MYLAAESKLAEIGGEFESLVTADLIVDTTIGSTS
jgi:hypothetical protein